MGPSEACSPSGATVAPRWRTVAGPAGLCPTPVSDTMGELYTAKFRTVVKPLGGKREGGR